MEKTWTELGMQHTSFDYPNKRLENTSTFYIHDEKEGRVIAPPENRSFMYAGGGYLSTAEDLVRMGKTLLENSYLSKEYATELFQPQLLTNGKSTHYGLGWEVGESRLNTPIVYHSGSMNTARSHLILYPDENVVFAYLSNTGDQVFFNDREAQNIAELFVEAKRKAKTQNTEPEALVGEWEISTTSLRDKKTKGKLVLQKTEHGTITGHITFKRSRKTGQYPVIVTGIKNNRAHLIGVTPMFIDFYLNLNKDSFTGTWLHDFNVKGIPEDDDYWNPRAIKGQRL
jgi:hypothetical protein